MGRLRVLVVLGVVLYLLFWGLAVAAQPAFDVSRDLTSHLAARGARLPVLGGAAVLALALAHAATAVLAGRSDLPFRPRRAATAGLATAAAATAAVAATPVRCPRGARGCGGPDSGRPADLPLVDQLHAVAVVVFQVGFVVAAVALAVGWWARGRRVPSALSAAAATASPLLLLAVDRGDADGVWQVRWSVVGCAWLVLVAVAARPAQRPASSTTPPRAPPARPVTRARQSPSGTRGPGSGWSPS